MKTELSDVARALFDAYQAQDRAAADALVADDFRFTSPQDDHIDRGTWFETCFPTADRFAYQNLLYLTNADDERIFVVYEYQLHTGQSYRNVELLRISDGRVHESQVYFGGRYSLTGG